MNVMYFIIPKCDVAFVYDDFNVRQVLEKIEYYKYSAMPVIDRSGHYVGTITEGDYLPRSRKNIRLISVMRRTYRLRRYGDVWTISRYVHMRLWKIL